MGSALGWRCAASALLLASLAQAQTPYQRLRASVQGSLLQQHLSVLGKLPCRLAGSEGESVTRAYAAQQLRAMGAVLTETQDFSVPVPKGGAKLIQSSETRVYPLWPNQARSNWCDIEGRIGPPGSPMPDIVITDWDGEEDWRTLAAQGAKAILFRAPALALRRQAEAKFANVPVDVPRFWVPAGAKVSEGRARLVCSQLWEQAAEQNLFFSLPGGDEHEIQLTVHTDGISIVPELSPGGQSAASVAALLEAVRLLSQEPRRHRLSIGLLGGHFAALSGARNAALQMLERGHAPLLTVSLDLDTDSRGLGVFGRGWFYELRDEAMDPLRFLTRNMGLQASDFPQPALLDTVNSAGGLPWRSAVPGRFAFDCEPFAQASVNAITFATSDSARWLVDTPSDTSARVDLDSLAEQTARIAAHLRALLNDPVRVGNNVVHSIPLPSRPPERQTLTSGFARVEGQAVRYDPSKGFFANVPVPGALVIAAGRQRTMMGVRGDIMVIADQTGRFRLEGLPTINCWRDMYKGPTVLTAFDVRGGPIVAAPKEGILGTDDFPRKIRLTSAFHSSPLVLFPCRTLDVFGLSDPQDLTPLGIQSVLDPRTDGEPENWGLCLPTAENQPNFVPDTLASVFLDPAGTCRLLLGSGPEMRGPLMGPYGPGTLNTADVAASSLLDRTGTSLNALKAGRAAPRALLAEYDRLAGVKPGSRAESQRLWGEALRLYPQVMGQASGLTFGALFMMALLIPFAAFLERLLLGSRSLPVSAGVSLGIFLAGFLALRALHPAFQVVSNPAMIFVAFVMGFLSILVSVFIVSKFEAGLRKDRLERVGIREIDITRGGAFSAAMSLAIGSLRRRRTRTLLSAATLTVMTAAVLAFTGISPTSSAQPSVREGRGAYSGLLLRNPGLEPLPGSAVEALRLEFGEVARRAVYFGAEFTGAPVLTAQAGGQAAPLRAVWGIDPEETRLLQPQRALVSGRWLSSDQPFEIVLPASLFPNGAPTQVRVAGHLFDVVGLYDTKKMDALRDLDGDAVMPPDLGLSRQAQERSFSATKAFRSFIRLDSGACAIVSADRALDMGGEIRSVAASIPRDQVEARLKGLMKRLRINLYAGQEGGPIWQYSSRASAGAKGLGLTLLQLVLAGLFVLNALMASVYERRTEIGIYSAIGLAPNHIAAVFYAEALVLAVLGSVGGYFVAQSAAIGLARAGQLGSLEPNFSSLPSMAAAAAVFAIALASAAYPAQIAKRTAAPALTEEDGAPAGDEWESVLPFRLGSDSTSEVLSKFHAWLSGCEEHAIGSFISSGTRLEEGIVCSRVWLAPFDLGISQDIRIFARATAIEGVSELVLQAHIQSGEHGHWMRTHREFLAAVRRQFLAF